MDHNQANWFERGAGNNGQVTEHSYGQQRQFKNAFSTGVGGVSQKVIGRKTYTNDDRMDQQPEKTIYNVPQSSLHNVHQNYSSRQNREAFQQKKLDNCLTFINQMYCLIGQSRQKFYKSLEAQQYSKNQNHNQNKKQYPKQYQKNQKRDFGDYYYQTENAKIFNKLQQIKLLLENSQIQSKQLKQLQYQGKRLNKYNQKGQINKKETSKNHTSFIDCDEKTENNRLNNVNKDRPPQEPQIQSGLFNFFPKITQLLSFSNCQKCSTFQKLNTQLQFQKNKLNLTILQLQLQNKAIKEQLNTNNLKIQKQMQKQMWKQFELHLQGIRKQALSSDVMDGQKQKLSIYQIQKMENDYNQNRKTVQKMEIQLKEQNKKKNMLQYKLSELQEINRQILWQNEYNRNYKQQNEEIKIKPFNNLNNKENATKFYQINNLNNTNIPNKTYQNIYGKGYENYQPKAHMYPSVKPQKPQADKNSLIINNSSIFEQIDIKNQTILLEYPILIDQLKQCNSLIQLHIKEFSINEKNKMLSASIQKLNSNAQKSLKSIQNIDEIGSKILANIHIMVFDYKNMKIQSEEILHISNILKNFQAIDKRLERLSSQKHEIQNDKYFFGNNKDRIIKIIQTLVLYYKKVANEQDEEKQEINQSNQTQVKGLKQIIKQNQANFKIQKEKLQAQIQNWKEQFNKKSIETSKSNKALYDIITQFNCLKEKDNLLETDLASYIKKITQLQKEIIQKEKSEESLNKKLYADEINKKLKQEIISKAQQLSKSIQHIAVLQAQKKELTIVLQKTQRSLSQINMERDSQLAKCIQLQESVNDLNQLKKCHQGFMQDIIHLLEIHSGINQKLDFCDQYKIIELLQVLVLQTGLFSTSALLPCKKKFLIRTIEQTFMMKVAKTQLIFFTNPNHAGQSLINIISKQVKTQGLLILYHGKNDHILATVHQNLGQNNKGILVSLTNQKYFPSSNIASTNMNMNKNINYNNAHNNNPNNPSLSIQNNLFLVYGRSQLKLKNSNLNDLELNRNMIGSKCYNMKDQDFTLLTGSYYNSMDLKKIEVFKITFQKLQKFQQKKKSSIIIPMQQGQTRKKIGKDTILIKQIQPFS